MSWILKEKGFDPENTVTLGNRFLTGNGYLGYRGTLDEFTAKDCVALNVAGLYDGIKGKWRETVNAFNPLYMAINCGESPLDVRGENVISHEIALDISCGVFSRRTVYSTQTGKIEVFSERFVSQADKNIICSRTQITAENDCEVIITAGVDTVVWDLNGPHIKSVNCSSRGNEITACGVTQENGVKITVTTAYSRSFENSKGGFAQIRLNLKGGEPAVLERVAGVFCGEQARLPVKEYGALYAENKSVWQKLWRDSDVKICGNDRAQFALRYSIYQLLILSPKGDCSIAARGLSGQTYKGAVFWDTEIFLLPFYLTADPETAERLVSYRINTLPEARKKAQSYGFDGAFYAWESQNGFDACSDFNVTDVFTHRPVRTYFKDKQIHISADVAYALVEYYSRTGDDKLMLSGGLETVLECARFLFSYSYYNHVKERFELLDVIGPDEYHERVNNNAYTNYMAHYAAKNAVSLAEKFLSQYPQEIYALLKKFPVGFLSDLKNWAEKLYLPKPDERGIIEQFDGYFKLEDVGVEEVRSRLVNPNEYWGGSGGVATATRVIKQADVIMLFNLLPDLFPPEIQRANYGFYLPYTEHGSSLSHCAYALTACRTGEEGGAFEAFLNSAEIDLRGGGKQWAGEIYIGGTHPAASGGAWMTAVYGFAGLSFSNGEMKFKPFLPKGISSVSFTAVEKGERYAVTVDKQGIKKEKIL